MTANALNRSCSFLPRRPFLPLARRCAQGAALVLITAAAGCSSQQGLVTSPGGTAQSSGGSAQGEVPSTLPPGTTPGPTPGTYVQPDGTVVTQEGTVTTPAEQNGLIAPGPRFPIVPMHVLPAPGATGAEARVDLELRADGTIWSHGHPVGQLQGERIVGTQGQDLLSVTPEGTVVLSGTPTRIRLLDTGEIVRPDGGTLRFGEDGVPLSTAPGGAPQRGAMRIEGLRPDAQRTAALLALLVATVALP